MSVARGCERGRVVAGKGHGGEGYGMVLEWMW